MMEFHWSWYVVFIPHTTKYFSEAILCKPSCPCFSSLSCADKNDVVAITPASTGFQPPSSHGKKNKNPGERWWPFHIPSFEPAVDCNWMARWHWIKPMINFLQEPCCTQDWGRFSRYTIHLMPPLVALLNTLRARPTFILLKWVGSMQLLDGELFLIPCPLILLEGPISP